MGQSKWDREGFCWRGCCSLLSDKGIWSRCWRNCLQGGGDYVTNTRNCLSMMHRPLESFIECFLTEEATRFQRFWFIWETRSRYWRVYQMEFGSLKPHAMILGWHWKGSHPFRRSHRKASHLNQNHEKVKSDILALTHSSHNRIRKRNILISITGCRKWSLSSSRKSRDRFWRQNIIRAIDSTKNAITENALRGYWRWTIRLNDQNERNTVGSKK